MKTIVCAIEKGGQGKSMLASHIAWLAAATGKKVLAVDLDGQGNFSSYLLGDYDRSAAPCMSLFGKRPADPLKVEFPKGSPGSIHVFTGDKTLRSVDESERIATTALRDSLQTLANGFDMCVIDAPPGSAKRMEAGLIAADHVVMPFEAKAASVHGLNDLLETLKSIQRDANPHLNIIGLLPNRINSRSKHQQELLTLVQGIAPGKVLPFSIQERTSIEYALELQIPVWQNVNGASHRLAANEVLTACTHILKTLFKK